MTAPVLAHDWFPRPLPGNVELGPRSWLYSAYAFVHCRSTRPVALRLGADSGVYHGSFFDLGPQGEVAIGDFVTVVGAIFATDGRVTIGDHAMIAHEVVIADGAAAGPDAVARGRMRRGTARIAIGPNAWIGARAVLLDGADIGTDAIVGAGTVVDFAVPPGAIVAGNPARVVGTCHRRGDRRAAP